VLVPLDLLGAAGIEQQQLPPPLVQLLLPLVVLPPDCPGQDLTVLCRHIVSG
jgi:hypothetical protein